MTAAQVVLALAPSALICGIFMLMAWRPRSNGTSRQRGAWGGPLGIGLGFFASFLILNNGLPGLPPAERWQWLFFMAIAATAVGFVVARWQPSGWLRLMVVAALAIVTGSLLQPPPPDEGSVVWRVALAALVLIQSLSLDQLSRRRTGLFVPLAMAIVFCGAGIVLFQSGNANFALMAASVAAMLFVIAAMTWINPQLSLVHGTADVLSVLLSSFLIIGWLYNGTIVRIVPFASFVLLAVAPLMIWLGESPAIAQMKRGPATVIRIALVLIPVLVAVGIAMTATEPFSAW